jgi:hypothetical protein
VDRLDEELQRATLASRLGFLSAFGLFLGWHGLLGGLALEAIEIEDVEARVSDLERAAEERKG